MKCNHMSWRWGTTIGLLVLNLAIVLWLLHGPSSAQEAKRFVYRVVDVPGDTQGCKPHLMRMAAGAGNLWLSRWGTFKYPG